MRALRPCEVRDGDVWRPGELYAWRRGDAGWRGLVRYRVDLLQFQQWRPAAELRPGAR